MLQKPASRFSGSRIGGAALIAMSMLSWLMLRVVPRMTHHNEFESAVGWVFLTAILFLAGMLLLLASD
jgi:hypothetical protein